MRRCSRARLGHTAEKGLTPHWIHVFKDPNLLSSLFFVWHEVGLGYMGAANVRKKTGR